MVQKETLKELFQWSKKCTEKKKKRKITKKCNFPQTPTHPKLKTFGFFSSSSSFLNLTPVKIGFCKISLVFITISNSHLGADQARKLCPMSPISPLSSLCSQSVFIMDI